jgi:signal peptidase I
MNKGGLIYVFNIAYELGKWAFVIIIIGSLIHYFLVTLFVISGASMEPEFHNGQVVVVSRIGLFTGKYKRGDPMVIKFPGDPEHKKYIKRLIGLPNEKIKVKNNEVFINNTKITESYIKPVAEEFLPYYYEFDEWEQEAQILHTRGKVLIKPDVETSLGPNDYFLMGDNRENSNDSRKWFPAPKSDIIGPVRFIIGEIISKKYCVGTTTLCFPGMTFKNWGPVVNPYYSDTEDPSKTNVPF